MIRGFFLLTIFLLSSAAIAVAPPSWQADDLPQRASERFTVEIATFPSVVLASGVRKSLENFGWGPTIVIEENGNQVVALGDFSDLGMAWYLVKELEHQDIARGSIRQLPDEYRSSIPRGASGPFIQPFLPTMPPTVDGEVLTAEQAIDRLRQEIGRMEISEKKEAILEALELWEDGQLEALAFGKGILLGIEFLRTQGAGAETILFLAGKLAREEWPSAARESVKAGAIMADLLHSVRGDWRAAWASNSALLASSSASTEEKVDARLRQVALLADLIKEGNDPVPSFAQLRVRLRQAADVIKEDNKSLEAKIASVYLQTFAWEGDWKRVEELAIAFRRDYPKQRPYWDMVTIYYAKSLERERAYEQAIDVLTELLNDPADQSTWPRFGLERTDLRERAIRERLRFQELVLKENGDSEESAELPSDT